MSKKFELGKVYATKNVTERAEASPQFFDFCHDSLRRHMSGDWGNLDPEDAELNDAAINSDTRIISVYIFSSDVTLWIITEADRSSTTMLFPEEY